MDADGENLRTGKLNLGIAGSFSAHDPRVRENSQSRSRTRSFLDMHSAEEPFQKQLRPERHCGSIVVPDPKAVSHTGVDVKFCRHARPFESQVEL